MGYFRDYKTMGIVCAVVVFIILMLIIAYCLITGDTPPWMREVIY